MTKNVTIKWKHLLQIRIKLPAKGIILMLKPNCNSHPCSILVRDFKQSQLFHMKSKGDAEIFKPFYNTERKEMYLFISLDPNHLKYKDKDDYMNVSIEIFATGCFHWNDLKDMWSSDGCKVGQHSFFPES